MEGEEKTRKEGEEKTRKDLERDREDLEARNLKKPKENGLDDSQMDDVMKEANVAEGVEGTRGQKQNSASPVKNTRKLVSYKDIVLQLNGDDNGELSGEEEDWKEIHDKEEEDFGNLEDMITEDQIDPLYPVYQYSSNMHKHDCRKWKNGLIVNLLGKRVNNRFLITRLLKIWSLKGKFEITDMDNGYILFNLQDNKDYYHVLHEGPWVVVEHYVMVQRWRPHFDPFEDQLKRLAVWVRISGLPLEFYSSHHLWRIGNLFGKTLKVDRNSLRKTDGGEGEYTEKAKYARICVEIDLRKSFIPKFQLGGKLYPVAYEGLHLICFNCGRYGHRQDLCSGGVEEKSMNSAVEEVSNQESKPEAVEDKEEAFGEEEEEA